MRRLKLKHPKTIIVGLTLLVMIMYVFVWYFTHGYESVSQAVFVRITTRRTMHLIAMVISATLIALSSLTFQTITHNRILTPSILGFDSIFLAVQTLLIYFLSSQSLLISSPLINFMVTSLMMIIISVGIYQPLLRRFENNLALLLLFGIIVATGLRSFISFVQTMLDPNEFQSLAMLSNVTINNMNLNLIGIISPLMVVIIVLFARLHHDFDVMALGRSHAIGLGLHYDRLQSYALILISLSMAIATALVGPLSFLGLMAINASRELLKTFKHGSLMVFGSLVGVILLVGGQLIVELTGFVSSVSVFINLFGGVYILYLIIKESYLWFASRSYPKPMGKKPF